jgi:hypothetical protein
LDGLGRVKKKIISNFMKISPVVSEIFHAGRRTDGRTNGRTDRQAGRQIDRQTDRRRGTRDGANIILAFRNFAKAPETAADKHEFSF